VRRASELASEAESARLYREREIAQHPHPGESANQADSNEIVRLCAVSKGKSKAHFLAPVDAQIARLARMGRIS
jgi:hypothetical protein